MFLLLWKARILQQKMKQYINTKKYNNNSNNHIKWLVAVAATAKHKYYNEERKGHFNRFSFFPS